MKSTIRRLSLAFLVVTAVVIAFASGTAVVSTRADGSVSGSLSVLNAPAAEPTYTTDSERLLNSLYESVSPSVVLIHVSINTQNGSGEATGSGFIYDQSGNIVTNNHVVDGASDISVMFYDGRIVRGEIVGVDADSDLAVIHVDNVPAESMRPLPLADSGTLFVGQEVFALGAPFNQAWTMTTGIISALDRSIQGLTQFSIGSAIQTDAAINPGNSGGPLLNMQGEVVGVNSQILSRSNSSSGIGFAIPSSLVSRVAESLIANGRVDYSYLGLTGTDMSLGLIEALNLPNTTQGVVVSSVERDSPAANGGLLNPTGTQTRLDSIDIIISVDGIPVSGMPDLIAYLASSTQPGQLINLNVLRDGQTITLPITLTARPRN
ncbi:MAG: trypsin-like peptidase domain-containing protein [Anaerolineae bacterium]|nr:trypsin-like peptidase domain-containing protein [Anaerolineae bacterium]